MADTHSLDPLMFSCLESMDGSQSDDYVFQSLLIVDKLIKNNYYTKQCLSALIAEAIDVKYVKKMLFKTGNQQNLFKQTAISIFSYMCRENKMFIFSEMVKILHTFKQLLNPPHRSSRQIETNLMQCIGFMMKFKAGKKQLIEAGFPDLFIGRISEDMVVENLLKYLFELLSYAEENEMFNPDDKIVEIFTLLLKNTTIVVYFGTELMQCIDHYKRYMIGGVEPTLVRPDVGRTIWDYFNYILGELKLPEVLTKHAIEEILHPFTDSVFGAEMKRFLISICEVCQGEIWNELPDTMARVLSEAIVKFNQTEDDDALKSSCQLLEMIFPSNDQISNIRRITLANDTQKKFHESLLRVFKLKLSQSERPHALGLALKGMQAFGMNWLLLQNTLDSDPFFFLRLNSLICIDAQVKLKEIGPGEEIFISSHYLGKYAIEIMHILFFNTRHYFQERITKDQIRKSEQLLLNTVNASLAFLQTVASKFEDESYEFQSDLAESFSSLFYFALHVLSNWGHTQQALSNRILTEKCVATVVAIFDKLMPHICGLGVASHVYFCLLIVLVRETTADAARQTDVHVMVGKCISEAFSVYTIYDTFVTDAIAAAYHVLKYTRVDDDRFFTEVECDEYTFIVMEFLPLLEGKLEHLQSRVYLATIGLKSCYYLTEFVVAPDSSFINIFIGSALQLVITCYNELNESYMDGEPAISKRFMEHLVSLLMTELSWVSASTPDIRRSLLENGWIQEMLETIHRTGINKKNEGVINKLFGTFLRALMKDNDYGKQISEIMCGAGIQEIFHGKHGKILRNT